MSNDYHDTRLNYDSRRDVLWKTLNRAYFSSFYNETSTVLDVGCGYGNFINNSYAKHRIALDSWTGFTDYIEGDIQTIIGNLTAVSQLENKSVDFVLASNIFEHVSQKELSEFLAIMSHKLSDSGTINILQPNYRYAYKEYFDDYTHISVYSHISLCDFLEANGYRVSIIKPRFLPLTIKSRLPVSSWLIRLYLMSPLKPLAKQMFVQARVK